MDPKDGEDLCNTGPDEETSAWERKRARRVSFAEITSVHIFDRDDELETPPSSENPELGQHQQQPNEGLGFQKYVAEGDDSKEILPSEEEEEDERVLFVRDMDFSSSPGSAIGSTTSNDEDNFFGPVSASFIRSGRGLNSAASEDSHDITLDSTAFSMHFRSLVHSDSGGHFKTPTEVDFTSEDRSPFENCKSANSGSSMELTKVNKPISHWSASGGNSGGGSGSNDMSLIESNPCRYEYDYGRLSPTLDALLAEGSKDMEVISVPGKASILKSPKSLSGDGDFPTLSARKIEVSQLNKSEEKDLKNFQSTSTSAEVVCNGKDKLLETICGPASTPSDQNSYDCLVSVNDALPAFTSRINQIINDTSQMLPPSVDGFGNDAVKASANKLELGGVDNNNPVTPLKSTFQIGLTTNMDYVGQTGDAVMRESPKGERRTPIIGHSTSEHSGLLVEGSVSSLRAKRQAIFEGSAVRSTNEHIATPFAREQSSSILNRKDVGHGESFVSLRESISKFNLLEMSPFGAAVKVGDRIEKPVFSSHLQSPSYATLLSENGKSNKFGWMNVSVTLPEELSSNIAQKSSRKINRGENERYGIETPKVIRMSEESEATEYIEKHGNNSSQGFLPTVEPGKSIAPAVPAYQFSGSRKDMQPHYLTSENHPEKAVVATETHSSLSDMEFVFKENEHMISTPLKCMPSALNRSPHISGPLDENCVLPGALYQRNQYDKLANLDQRPDSVSRKPNDAYRSCSTPVVEQHPINGASLLKETRTDATTLLDVSADENTTFGKSKWLGHGEPLHPNHLSESLTPLRWGTSRDSTSAISNSNFRTRTDPTKFSKKVPESESLHRNASAFVRKGSVVATRLEKRLVEGMVEGSSWKEKETQDLSEKDSMHPFVTRNLSLGTIQCSDGHGHGDNQSCPKNLQESVQEVEGSIRKRRIGEIKLMEKDKIEKIRKMQKIPNAAPDMEGHVMEFQSESCPLGDKEVERTEGSALLGLLADGSVQKSEDYSRKRTTEEIKLTEKDNIDENDRMQKIPKKAPEMEGSLLEFQSEHYHLSDKGVEWTEGSASQGFWANVSRKFSVDMEEHLLPSSGKLNTRVLDSLEDMLDRLQKAKKYEKLCTLIEFQGTDDQPHNLQLRRAAEAKYLQATLIYGKAKMELLRVKQERLHKKLELLQSGIQKSDNLKSNLKNVLACDAQNRERQFPSFPVDCSSKKEDAYNKVITKRQELGALEKEVNNLVKSILDSCKIKGEPEPSETIRLVNDHLRKRIHCRLIQKELQIWEVDNVESKNDHHSLVLSYGQFLFQSFTVNLVSVLKIIITNRLNDANIMKSFPNMDACTAFRFVFNTEAAQSLVNSKSLAVQTQITSSLLGNLLDVLEEVQTAQIELRNLFQTSFSSPEAGMLELQLCFINFKIGTKVILTLDMTCLKRGMYPSEILPHFSATQAAQPLSVQIEATVGALETGYSRILRFCRCVSRIVQASSSLGSNQRFPMHAVCNNTAMVAVSSILQKHVTEHQT